MKNFYNKFLALLIMISLFLIAMIPISNILKTSWNATKFADYAFYLLLFSVVLSFIEVSKNEK